MYYCNQFWDSKKIFHKVFHIDFFKVTVLFGFHQFSNNVLNLLKYIFVTTYILFWNFTFTFTSLLWIKNKEKIICLKPTLSNNVYVYIDLQVYLTSCFLSTPSLLLSNSRKIFWSFDTGSSLLPNILLFFKNSVKLTLLLIFLAHALQHVMCKRRKPLEDWALSD